MKKLGLFIIFSLFLIPTIVLAVDFDITGENVILYNLNEDEVLYKKNEEEKTQIASLTKMMSAYVGILSIDNLDDEVVIKTNDFSGLEGYSKAGFKVGDVVTYRDLLYGIILPSGADAVNAVVNNTLGYDRFIKKMNEVAQDLVLQNTRFENPIGKDNENNYSTAKDMATFLKSALENDTFKKVFTTKRYVTSNGLVLNSTVSSYDELLNISLIVGAKSGFTKGAGRCLASISSQKGVDYLLVVINSSTKNSYNAVKDSITIYDYYQSNYGYQSILTDDTKIKSIPVSLSKKKSYEVTGNETVKKYLKNDTKITYEYEGVLKIGFNTKRGDFLGIVKIYDGDNLLATSKVYLEDNISYYPIVLYVICFVLIVLVLIRIRKRKRRKNGKSKTFRYHR